MHRLAKILAALLAALVTAGVCWIALAWSLELLYRLTDLSFFAAAMVYVSPMLFGWVILALLAGAFFVLYWRIFGLGPNRSPSNHALNTDAVRSRRAG